MVPPRLQRRKDAAAFCRFNAPGTPAFFTPMARGRLWCTGMPKAFQPGAFSLGAGCSTDPVIAVCAIYQSIIRRREGICQPAAGSFFTHCGAPPCSIPSVIAKKKTSTNLRLVDAPFVVPLTGIEPVRCCHRGILSPLRLPVPPQRRNDLRWNLSHLTIAQKKCQGSCCKMPPWAVI